MNRLRSLLVILSALIVSACRGRLPTAGQQLLLQMEGLYVISAESGDSTQWQPRSSGKLDIWAAAPDDYHHFVHDNAVIFVNSAGDYAKVAIGETNPRLLSPDGRYAGRLLDGNAVIWRVDQQQEAAQIVAEGVDVTGYWSPNARQFVYHQSQNGMDQHILYDVADGTHTLLIESGGTIRFPIWSADGAYYSFVTIQDEGTKLHQVSAETQQINSIILPFKEPTNLFYAAQTNRLISASRDDSIGQLHHINPTQNSVTQLLETPYFIKETAVSPDGASLFVVVDNWNHPDTLQLQNLSLVDDSSVSATLAASSIAAVKFAPVGNQIALLAGNRLLIWDGTAVNPRTIMPHADAAIQPISLSSFVWSADGETLYAMVAHSDDCQSKKTFSIALVPTIVDEVRCSFGLYRARVDGSEFVSVSEFRSPISASMESTLSWLP